MGYDGATLTLTPFAAQAMSDDEIRAMGIRAVELHCRLNVGKHTRSQEWVIRVSSWAKDPVSHSPAVYLERRYYAGRHLADCIGFALDDYGKATRYNGRGAARHREPIRVAGVTGRAPFVTELLAKHILAESAQQAKLLHAAKEMERALVQFVAQAHATPDLARDGIAALREFQALVAPAGAA